MNERHVIIGAGPLGRAVATELVARGRAVRVVSRTGAHGVAGAESAAADATSAEQLDLALAGASVVYQCAQPEYTRWAQEFPALQSAILEATVRAGADLVIADNLYMYGDPAGSIITEQSGQNPHTKKGRVRKAMADAALAAHAEGRLRVALSRPSDYFGPGHDQSSKGIFAAAVQGRAMSFFGRMDQPHSLSFVPDAAAAMATLGTSEAGWGRSWIAPVQPAITQAEFAERVWRAAGQSGAPKVRVTGRRAVQAVGLIVPIVREFSEMVYEWEAPYVVSSADFESTFDVTPTPLDEAIARTVSAYRA